MIVYRIGIMVLFSIGRCTSLFHKKKKIFFAGQKNIFTILKNIRIDNRKVVWFHAASLGEFEQGRSVIEKLKKEQKHIFILLTFFSPSGYEVRKNYKYADCVTYLPIDTHRNVKKFYDLVNPDVIVFIKYEFWLGYIVEANVRNKTIILISALFRKEQIFFRWYGGLFRKALRSFSHIFVQNKQSNDLLASIGIPSEISGDTRFDTVWEIKKQKKEYPIIERFKILPIFIAGSVWESDMFLLYPVIERFQGILQFIIVPHEINTKFIESIENNLPSISTTRYSIFEDMYSKKTDVLIIDNVGMLSSLYAFADFAYIGGAFHKGLHNILEAAVFGIPIFFGKNNSLFKFHEAIQLIKKKSAFATQNPKQLSDSLLFLLQYNGERETICKTVLQYVKDNLGASNMIYRYIIASTF